MRRYNESVVMQTEDRGPYRDEQFDDGGRPRQSKGFLTGDYWAIRLKHHQLNKPDLPFIKTFRCDGDGCGYTQNISIFMGDEDSDGYVCPDGIYRMRLKMLDDEVAQQFKERNVFETELGSKRIQFKLSDMDALEKFRTYARRYRHEYKKDLSDGQRMLVITACRILRVEGEPENLKSHLNWFGSLDDDESTELILKMDEFDCGIDWEVYPECPRCDEVKTMIVDLDEHFFSRGRQRRSAASRT